MDRIAEGTRVKIRLFGERARRRDGVVLGWVEDMGKYRVRYYHMARHGWVGSVTMVRPADLLVTR